MANDGSGKRPRLQEPNAEEDEVCSLLLQLNTGFREAQALASAATASAELCQELARRGTLFVEASKRGERGAVSAGMVAKLERELEAGPAAFDARRRVLEGPKEVSFVWHGPTSLQRVLLQDRRFVEITQETEAASLLVALALSGGGELRALLLGALHSKLLLGYMATASPNWESLPRLEGVAWDMAYAFVQHDRLADEDVVQITPALLRRRLQSLQNIAGALMILAEGCEHAGCDARLEARLRVLADAPLEAVLTELPAAVAAPAQAAVLAQGPSGASTDLYPMICQTLAVMAHFGAASASVGGAAAALSLGAFSHALDAKHLLAALHALRRWPPKAEFPGSSFGAFLHAMPAAAGGGSGPNPEGRGLRRETGALEAELRAGLAEVRGLLQRCREGRTEPLEAQLLLCRLRQALLLQAVARAPTSAFAACSLGLAAYDGEGWPPPDATMGRRVAELAVRCREEPDSCEPGRFSTAVEHMLAELCDLPAPSRIWLLTRIGEPTAVAGVAAACAAGSESGAMLVQLCLEEGFRRQGLGQALYEVVEEWAVAAGFQSLRLALPPGKPAAFWLCERNGLREGGRAEAGWRVKGLEAGGRGARTSHQT